MSIDHTGFRVTRESPFLTRDQEHEREKTQEEILAERQVLWRAAMNQACMDSKFREPLARKMYRGEGITLDDWPTLGPLTPVERTAIIRETRRILGMPERQEVRHG